MSPVPVSACSAPSTLTLQLGDPGRLLGGLAALAEHQPHDLGLELLGRAVLDALAGDLPGDATLAQNRDAVAEGDRLVQLVGDEHDREPRGLEPLEHLLQLGDRLRRQHRGGLVEDQDSRPPPERLDDLDLLLAAEREVFGARVGLDLDAEHGAELLEPPTCAREVQPQTAALAEHQVLDHGQRADQCRVLVDRADAEVEGLAWRVDLGLLARDLDAARVGLKHPREDAHQRRLARAVLAQQAVNLAEGQRQGDVVIGQHAGEGLA